MIRLLTAIVLLSASTETGKGGTSSPQVRNELRRCLEVQAGQPREEENLLLLPAHMKFSASVGTCGCRSGGIRYRVFETYRGRAREMNTGILNSVGRTGTQSDILLVLNTDTMINRTPPFRIDLVCEQ